MTEMNDAYDNYLNIPNITYSIQVCMYQKCINNKLGENINGPIEKLTCTNINNKYGK